MIHNSEDRKTLLSHTLYYDYVNNSQLTNTGWYPGAIKSFPVAWEECKPLRAATTAQTAYVQWGEIYIQPKWLAV